MHLLASVGLSPSPLRTPPRLHASLMLHAPVSNHGGDTKSSLCFSGVLHSRRVLLPVPLLTDNRSLFPLIARLKNQILLISSAPCASPAAVQEVSASCSELCTFFADYLTGLVAKPCCMVTKSVSKMIYKTCPTDFIHASIYNWHIKTSYKHILSFLMNIFSMKPLKKPTGCLPCSPMCQDKSPPQAQLPPA